MEEDDDVDFRLKFNIMAHPRNSKELLLVF